MTHVTDENEQLRLLDEDAHSYLRFSNPSPKVREKAVGLNPSLLNADEEDEAVIMAAVRSDPIQYFFLSEKPPQSVVDWFEENLDQADMEIDPELHGGHKHFVPRLVELSHTSRVFLMIKYKLEA